MNRTTTHQILKILPFFALLMSCGQTPMGDQKNLAIVSEIDAPANLKATGSSTEIALSWENPSFDGDYYIRVQHREGNNEFTVDATLDGQSEYKISDLETLKNYEVRLQAITKDGSSSAYSDTVNVLTHVSKGYIGDKEIILPNVNDDRKTIFTSVNATKTTWTWTDSDLSGIESYDISRKRNSETDWTFVSSVTSIIANPQFIDNTPGALIVAYRITVHYKDDANTIANFDTDFANYDLPGVTDLKASYNSYNSVTLNWGWSSVDTTSISSYEIFKEKYSEGTWSLVSTVSTIAKTFTDSNVQATTVRYRIRVHYQDSSNTIRDFDMATAISFNLPSANTLAASYSNYNSVVFTWKWSSSDLTSIMSYDIYRQILNNGTWTKVNASAITTIGTSFTDTNPAATTVKYRLSVHYKDDKSTTTNFDMTSSVSYALPQPSTPTVKIVNADDVQLSWSWTNTSNFDVLSSYKIQRSIDMATPVWTTISTVTSVNPPAASYIDTTVPWADEAFIYRIEVSYKSGAPVFDSTKSSSIDKPAPLAAPTSVKVAVSLSTSALVSWNYTLSAINVDEFEIQMTAKSSMGGTLGNPESTFRSYISTTSSYSQKIFYDTICTNNSADHVDFSVRVNPTDASINSSSAWIFAGSLICPTICFVGGNC